MTRPTPRATRPDTPFPYTTLFRSSDSALPGGSAGRLSPGQPSEHSTVATGQAGVARSARPSFGFSICHHSPRFSVSGFQTKSEEHTSELQSLMRISYAVFCLKKKNNKHTYTLTQLHNNKKQT